LKNWHEWGNLITLGQDKWDWNQVHITGSAVVDMRKKDGLNKYVMSFHGSCPLSESVSDFDKNVSIGLAWRSNQIDWE